jgi:protein-tyrosine-phosphatase
MAAALAHQVLGDTVRAESAGVSADDGASATKDAVRAMQERGLDISGHQSRSFQAVNLDDFDVVVALTPAIGEHLRRARVEPARIETLNIPDPYNRGLDAYRDTAGAIERDLKRLFGECHGEPTRE